MSEEREEVYQILELGKDLKNLHHKKGFGGLLFIDLSMIKFSKLSKYIRQLDKENQELKKQLEYLRSGEYYNQLRFENEMLQQVVDTNGVPSEVYDYIDCTHRNTELLEENQKYKEVIDKAIEYINKMFNTGFYNDDYYLGHLNQILQDKEVE